MDTFIERLFCKLTKNYLLASLKLKQFDLSFKRKRVCKKFECCFKNRDIITGSTVGLTQCSKETTETAGECLKVVQS